MIRNFRLLVLGAALLALGACSMFGADQAPSPRQLAYSLGESYKAVQHGAITYLQVANPSAATATAIEDADHYAAAAVIDVVEAAKDVDKPDPTAVADGLSPDEVTEAKTGAFQDLFEMAKGAIAKLKRLAGGV